jgi:NADP-dependent 3-hydroxy acid dehydrogenase YdfG
VNLQKVVAITGASAGIGEATARHLAARGAAVVVSARRLDRLEELASDITRAGGKALPVAADVTRPADMDALVKATLSGFGRLDVMICNAGFGIYGAIDAIEPDQMHRLLDVNYLGTYHAIRAALPHFRAQRSGHLIVVSSIVGKRGVPYMGAYAATKFAQVGLAEGLRPELSQASIDVSVVFPISTETEFFSVMTAESGFATRARGPRQSAADVAAAIGRAIDHPVPEVYPYRKARGLVLLNALSPRLCDRFVRRFGREPVSARGE